MLKTIASSLAHPLLKKHGLKDTQPRRLVLEALSRSKAPVSHYALRDKIVSSGKTIDTVTVYRTIETFEKIGLVHRHPCDGHVSLCTMPETPGHHGFLHCTSCKNVEEYCSEELCRKEHGIAKQSGFTPTSHISEIIGICRSCNR